MNEPDFKRENQISGIILDAAITVHSAIGPGLLESAYQACLLYELRSRELNCQAQVPLPIQYDQFPRFAPEGWLQEDRQWPLIFSAFSASSAVNISLFR